MKQKILKRTWIQQKTNKLLPHKGYRYDEGTWFAEIHNESWRSFVLLKREINDSNQIIEYLCEDDVPRLPLSCLWIEEYTYDLTQQHELLMSDWNIQEELLSQTDLIEPPQPVLSLQPVLIPQSKQHPSRQQQHFQPSKALKHPQIKKANPRPEQLVKPEQSAPLKHTKTKGKVKRPSKLPEPSSYQSSSSPENHAQRRQPNSNKQVTHHPPLGVTVEPLPIQHWTPLQTLLQVPLPLKQQVSVSVAPKGKSQNLPRKRAGRPKKSNSQNSTHVDSSTFVQKPSIVTM